jgi:hypothetical protein
MKERMHRMLRTGSMREWRPRVFHDFVPHTRTDLFHEFVLALLHLCAQRSIRLLLEFTHDAAPKTFYT